MSIIISDGISLSYGVKDVLCNITFAVNQGSRVGVIGANGAGKTSLFRIITGTEKPTEGKIFIGKGATVGFLEQITDNISFDKSVLDTAYEANSHLILLENEIQVLHKKIDDGYEGYITAFTTATERFHSLGGYEYRSKTRSFLKSFGFSEEMLSLPAAMLSGGQKTRLMLVSLLLREPDIIMLDEPTNHLDIESVSWLENFIKSSKKTFLIISHDRYFLDNVTTDTLEIENNRAVMYKGSYSVFKEKKEKLREDMLKHYELQQKEIKRIEAFIENQRRWGRERNIIAAESRMKMLDRMEKLDKPKDAPRAVSFSIAASTGKSFEVLSVRELSKSYPGINLFDNLSFELHYGDRMFIIGKNGCGKSTLLKILTDREKQDDGIFELGYNQSIGYYDQDQQLLDQENTVIEELWSSFGDKTVSEIRGILARFGFFGDDIYKRIPVLSGGERARLSIAKMILNGVSLLILDEPTNHLDIPSKETLEFALKEYKGTVLCVSHDRYFISSLATDILELAPERSNTSYTVYKGGYRAYISAKENDTPPPACEEEAVSVKKADYLSAKKEKNRKRYIANRIPAIEAEITDMEKQLGIINELKIGEAATDFIRLNQLYEQEAVLETDINALYKELLMLEEEMDGKAE
ncbi:MAG: ABC transporter ATP-binding protein [Firmicutes bacterium HGW-Firmicutes-21]|nr:MAG: ABC transporter ATP-binding protein [Firmicutes bacterium HGW-Firmicutes-21]